MADLRIGQRVQTPRGEEIVTSFSPAWIQTTQRSESDGVAFESVETWGHADVEPLPPDIPRTAVEDLLAAVEKRRCSGGES